MAEKQTNEALEKLNQGIQESRQIAQQQTMQLAQDFFGDSVDLLKREINDSRATLENLPDQVPGGQDEAFQILFQELMRNYAAIEGVLDEAKSNVEELDTEQLKKEGEFNASEASRREARALGVDLAQVEGTGNDGRIIVSDVIEAVMQAGDGSDGGPKASYAVRSKAEELGIDLSEIEGSGPGGIVTLKDVTDLGDEAGEQAAEGVTGAPGQASGGANDVAEQVEDTLDLASNGASGVADQALEAVTRVAGEANGSVGQAERLAGEDGTGEGPRVTSAARRKAEELGVDLSAIQGSGAGGLITIKDVLKA